MWCWTMAISMSTSEPRRRLDRPPARLSASAAVRPAAAAHTPPHRHTPCSNTLSSSILSNSNPHSNKATLATLHAQRSRRTAGCAMEQANAGLAVEEGLLRIWASVAAPTPVPTAQTTPAAVSGATALASRTDEEAIEIGKGLIEAVQTL